MQVSLGFSCAGCYHVVSIQYRYNIFPSRPGDRCHASAVFSLPVYAAENCPLPPTTWALTNRTAKARVRRDRRLSRELGTTCLHVLGIALTILRSWPGATTLLLLNPLPSFAPLCAPVGHDQGCRDNEHSTKPPHMHRTGRDTTSSRGLTRQRSRTNASLTTRTPSGPQPLHAAGLQRRGTPGLQPLRLSPQRWRAPSGEQSR